MKLNIHGWLAFVALSALGLSACADTTSNHQDKNTNWLMDCETSAQCGDALQCVCGVCTTVCERDAQCSGHGELSVCGALAISGSACSAQERGLSACTLSCESDGTCSARNDDLVCIADRCALEPVLEQMDGGPLPDGGPIGDGGPTMDSGSRDGGPEPDSSVDGSMDATMPTELEAACGTGFRCESVVDAPGHAESFVADPLLGHLYWTDWGTLDALQNYNDDGAIKRVLKTGGEVEVVREVDRPWRLWLDTNRMYWQSGEVGDFGAGPGIQRLYWTYRSADLIPPDEDSGVAPDDVTMLVHEGTDLDHVQINGSRAAWQTATASGGTPGVLVTYGNLLEPLEPPTLVSITGSFTLFGVDRFGVYLDDGGGSILRYQSGPEELLDDPPGFLPTLVGNAIWLIHTTDDNRDWVAAMPSSGGALTNVGDASNYFDAPQPGANVVWLATGEQGTSTWQLWVMPKNGGERELAFSFPTERSVVREDAPPPLWIADGDQAWVFGFGKIVRVLRQ